MLRSLSSLYGSKEAVFLPPIEISPVRFDLDSISRGMIRSRSLRSILWFASKLYLKARFTSYSFEPSYELMTLLEIVKLFFFYSTINLDLILVHVGSY